MRSFFRLLLATGLFFISTSCATTYGARTIPAARGTYNQALSSSWNEQLLLNLVRLRYRDTPVFLNITSVVTQYSWSRSAALGISDASDPTVDAGIGLELVESPTVTYTPLQGEDFAKRLLTALEPNTLFLLSQSGWSISRLMQCCLQQIGSLRNAPSASGPTPSLAPQYQPFRHLSNLLRDLQVAGLFELTSEETDDTTILSMELGEPPSAELAAKQAEIRQLLGLGEEVDSLRLHAAPQPKADHLRLASRSLIGVLFYLSQAVNPPGEHRERGLVTSTLDADGRPFDWQEVVGDLLHIRSSAEPPSNAFVRVFYRNHWFYIADSDLNSKTTFGLLTFLFSLQSQQTTGQAPVLSLTAGG